MDQEATSENKEHVQYSVDGYAAGLRTREIAQQLDIKDSTLRFHNKNIYDKLGVSSLKQLQQFVAILNSGSGSTPDESGPKKAR